MKRTFALAVTAWALVYGSAAAQQSSVPGTDLSRYVFAAKDAVPTPEEVEIFRRILDRSLQTWKANGTWREGVLTTDGLAAERWRRAAIAGTANTMLWDIAALQNPTQTAALQNPIQGVWFNDLDLGRTYPQTPELPRPEGTYLKGYGVVFTITLPWDGQNPIGEPAKAASKPQSEWEKVRKELRGEKSEPEKKETAQSPALADTVLKVLAENGRHFAQMTGNERVTVAITLRPAAPEAVVRRGVSNTLAEMVISSQWSEAIHRGSAQKQDFDKEYAIKKQEALNYVRLGDLRTNEKRYQEAVDAYYKATRSYEKMLELRRQAGNSIPDPIRGLLIDISVACDVYNKLAQTYYSLGENDKARNTLQAVAKAYERFQLRPAPKEKETPAKATLPGKLTISATKQILDQVGAGQMSFAEFRKAATVEYVPMTGGSRQAEPKQELEPKKK